MTHPIIEENYGKWKSSITPKNVAQKTKNYADLYIDGEKIYWSESRPWEKGRSFIVSQNTAGKTIDETSNIYNVATSVHGYGGGAFLVQDDIIYFHDAITNQVYKKISTIAQQITNLDDTIQQITNGEGFCYGDFSVDNLHKFLYCLRLNKNASEQFPITEIIQIEISTGLQEVLFSGADFYSNVRINKEGTKLLFLQWNYPNMPWDENELWTADISSHDFKVTNLNRIYYRPNVSVYQPTFHTDKIYCAVNENNYWEICELTKNATEFLCQYPADFGRPLWTAGTRTFAFVSDNEILATGCENGIWKTLLIDINNKSFTLVENGLTCIQNMTANAQHAVYIGGNPTQELNLLTSVKKIDNDDISIPKLIEFQSNGKKVYAFYYPPKNSKYRAPTNEKPPCIIKIHGGPTTCADFLYNAKIQFYTNRGFAYVDLNYSGSSGYGKEYRNRLNGKWGIVDVEDCIACAEFLCTEGLADKNKLILAGSSAGGFTLFNVLIKSNLFKCATCHYGVVDLAELASHIHKFEACYDQILIGDSLINNPTLYQQRSPINYVEKVKTPVILFHGNKDSVVPMSQTIKIAEELKKQNIFHEVYIFENEGHGFKKEESIITLLERELSFIEKQINF